MASRKGRGGNRTRGADTPPPNTTVAANGSLYPWLRDWQVVALFVVAIVLFFRLTLLAKAFFWEDFLLQVYPFRNFAAVSLAHGDVPLWNPYSFAGMPFQADIQSAVFYLPHLLMTPFARDGSLSFYAVEVMVIAHYVIAAAGMFVLARDSGLQRVYAGYAGLVYALSGFMIVRAIHPGFVEQAAWLPWIIFGLQRAIQRRSLRYTSITGLLAGHSILAGAPQISLYTFVLMGCYSAFLLLTETQSTSLRQRLATAWIPATVVAVAMGVAAIQLLPTLELAPLSERDALDFHAAQVGRLAWSQLITVVIPKFFGVHDAHGNAFWGPGGYGSYWETCFYWGVPAFLTAAVGATLARRHGLARFLVGIVVVSFLLALGDQLPFHKLFFGFVPGFSTFRAPARILLLATFAVALLSAMGLRTLAELGAQMPGLGKRAALGVMLAMGTIWGVVRFGNFLPINSDPILREAALRAAGQADTALLLVGLVCCIAVLLSKRIIGQSAAVGAIILLQFADVLHFGQDQNTGTQDAETFYHGRPEIRQLISALKQEQSTQLFRTTSRDGPVTMFDRNIGLVDGLYLTEGYTPLRLRRMLPPAVALERSYDLLNSKYRVTADTIAGKVRLGPAAHYLPRAMVVPEYRVISEDSMAKRFMEGTAFNPHRTVVLSQAPGISLLPSDSQRALPAPASMALLSYGANALGLSVTSATPGMLVLSEIYYPGWRAEVDGKETPIIRANVSLRALPVSAGTHTITMAFEPKSFRIGAWITIVTLLLSLGGLILGSRRLDHARAAP